MGVRLSKTVDEAADLTHTRCTPTGTASASGCSQDWTLPDIHTHHHTPPHHAGGQRRGGWGWSAHTASVDESTFTHTSCTPTDNIRLQPGQDPPHTPHTLCTVRVHPSPPPPTHTQHHSPLHYEGCQRAWLVGVRISYSSGACAGLYPYPLHPYRQHTTAARSRPPPS